MCVKMSYSILAKDKHLKKGLKKICSVNNVSKTASELSKYIDKNKKVLNLGCGTCLLDEKLLDNGYDIVSVDIYDGNLTEKIKPVVYDGENIPFKDNNFDYALLMSVLHHVPDQKKFLKEVKRVSKRIIVNEDVISNKHKRIAHSVFDNCINLDSPFCMNHYLSEEEWEKLFEELGLKIIKKKKKKAYLSTLNQALYVLE